MADQATAAAPAPIEPPPAISDKAHDNLATRSAEVIAGIKAEDDKRKAIAEGTYVEPKDDKAKTEPVEMDAATLAKLTEASEKERAARKRAEAAERKAKELETAQGDVVTLRDVKKLWSEGKRREAFKLLSGDDKKFEADAEEFLKEWVASPDGKGKVEVTAEEMAALKAELEETKKAEAARAAREKAETDQRNAERFSASIRDAKGEDGAARYPLASKPENSDEARTVALEKANARLLKLKITGPISRELAEDLMHYAYAEIEANLRKKETPAAEASPKPAAKPTETVNLQSGRGEVIPRATPTPAAPKEYPKTPEGASQKLWDSARRLGILPQ